MKSNILPILMTCAVALATFFAIPVFAQGAGETAPPPAAAPEETGAPEGEAEAPEIDLHDIER